LDGNKKKRSRGLEEVSHLFLSHQGPPEAKKQTEKQARPQGDESTPSPNNAVPWERHKEQAFVAPAKRLSRVIFFSSSGLFAEKSFLACNLALELAKRNYSVGLIETSTSLPNTFFLFGSLFPEFTAKEYASSIPGGLQANLKMSSALEPLRLMDISIEGSKGIKAVFWEKDRNCADSLEVLNGLDNESEFLIMNASPDILELREMICRMSPFFIVPTTVRSEQLLNSYLLIKQISRDTVRAEVALLIMDEGFSQNTEAAFRVIQDMTDKFLSCNIHFMGIVPKGAEFFQSILNRAPLLLDGKSSPLSRSISKLADKLIQNNSAIVK
jgi:flagellar biosynthesis protein FlhG